MSRSYIDLAYVLRMLDKAGIRDGMVREAVRERSRADLVPVVTCDECRYGAEVPLRNANHEDMTPEQMHVIKVKYGETVNDWTRTLVYRCQLTGLKRGRGFYCFDGERLPPEDSDPDG